MEDKILAMFFQPDRWHYAIEKGVGKDINKAHLYKLCKPEIRARMYEAVRDGRYEIAPPHTALIPKDTPGEFRTVYVNEPIDRVFLSIANDLLFELTPEFVHSRCKSYQKGIGCGKIVKEISSTICGTEGEIVGWKADFSKYFDSVPLEFIDKAFDDVESIHGHSAIIDVLRKYYHSDIYFDTDGILQESYQSLKQGCSVASWLADVVLYDLDEELSKLDGYYVRYSDDTLFVGKDYVKAMECMESELQKWRMKLNPKKVEYIRHGCWFKFLGFSIKGADISLSSTRIKKFQKEIESRTIKKRGSTFLRALNSVNRFLYKGNGEFSWATQVLPVINVKHDIDELNKFAMDCVRAAKTGKRRVGGLGYVRTQKNGCVSRGKGRNVTSNRADMGDNIPGFISLGCARNAMLTSKAAYNTLISQI